MDQSALITTFAASGGSWVIHVLFALSALAVAVIIERAVVIGRQCRYQGTTLPGLIARMDEGQSREFLAALRPETILHRVARELLDHASKGLPELERRLETRMALERRYLEKRLVVLGTLGNNAPFIGLLGTVLGVIRAFHDLGAAVGQGPEAVMQGISEALVATAVGILVALPCVAFYNYFQKRNKDVLVDADRFGKQLIAVLESRAGDAEAMKR